MSAGALRLYGQDSTAYYYGGLLTMDEVGGRLEAHAPADPSLILSSPIVPRGAKRLVSTLEVEGAAPRLCERRGRPQHNGIFFVLAEQDCLSRCGGASTLAVLRLWSCTLRFGGSSQFLEKMISTHPGSAGVSPVRIRKDQCCWMMSAGRRRRR